MESSGWSSVLRTNPRIAGSCAILPLWERFVTRTRLRDILANILRVAGFRMKQITGDNQQVNFPRETTHFLIDDRSRDRFWFRFSPPFCCSRRPCRFSCRVINASRGTVLAIRLDDNVSFAYVRPSTGRKVQNTGGPSGNKIVFIFTSSLGAVNFAIVSLFSLERAAWSGDADSGKREIGGIKRTRRNCFHISNSLYKLARLHCPREMVCDISEIKGNGRLPGFVVLGTCYLRYSSTLSLRVHLECAKVNSGSF